MENRFGLKDLILYVLVVIVIVMIWLSMLQRDRIWPKLTELQDAVNNQTHDLAAIRRDMAQGISVNPGTTAATTQASAGDPFKYVKEAQKMPGYALGDWYVDNFPVKVPTLTPLVSQDVYGAVTANRILESFAYRDPFTLDYIPLLATSWTTSKDGLSYTFKLRHGVTFSDGVAMTADDVVWTFNWIMNPAVNAPRLRAYYDKIASVEKTADDEVTFKFKEPYFESFDLASGMQIMPKHFYEKYTPEQFNTAPGLVMGTGPYKMKDPIGWRPGDEIQLYRNERYWGEAAPFDRLVYHQVEAEAASLTMFKNGELDVFSAQPEQYKILLNDPELTKRTQHFEYEAVNQGFSYIAWNEQRGGKPTRFADRRVRQAMTMLTDRQRICQEIFLGYAHPAGGPFSPLSKQYNPAIKPWPYDPTKAKELLKEAGYEDRNGDGVLESAGGEPLRFKLTYPSGSEIYTRVVLFLKDMYAKGGIAMEPDPQDWQIVMQRLNRRDYDAITLAWTAGIETDIYQWFHSSQMKDQGDDFMGYQNPKLDKLIDEARATVDEDKRIPLWRECHTILHEDQPYTFLFNRKVLAFFDKRIKNIKESKLGLNWVQRDVTPCPWFVPKAEQKWSK